MWSELDLLMGGLQARKLTINVQPAQQAGYRITASLLLTP